jgi:hypothetical protein
MHGQSHDSSNIKDDQIQDGVQEAVEVNVDSENSMAATVAAVGLVGAGVVMFEAALLPGLALGVAAMAAPKILPHLGTVINPVFKSAVRGFYKASQKTKEFVAETQEQVQDIVAEMEHEQDTEVSVDATEKKVA